MKELKELEALAAFTKALKQRPIDVEMAPDDPASVDAAIREMEDKVDAVARRYSRNKMVQAVAADIKTANAESIREEAWKAERRWQ